MGHRDRDWDSMDALRGLLAGMVDALGRLAHTATETARAVRALPRLEIAMASAAEQLTEILNAFRDFKGDVDAKLDQLLNAQGTLNPDAQAVYDEIKAAVAEADAQIGDADGSETPAPPVEPAPEV